MSPEPVDSTGGQPHRIRPGSMRVMLSIQSLVVAAAEAEHVELPIPAFGFGLIALALFAAGLVALWSFRNTAHGVEQAQQRRAQAQELDVARGRHRAEDRT